MADISLSKAVRANLLSLKGTADMMATTQNRLATGNKVNSALDNPSSWFTAKGLTNRASDLGALIDSMANGIQTLQAADNGLSAMTKTLESMQSTLRQARQDKSFQTASYTVPTNATGSLSFTGGALDGTSSIALTKAQPAKITGGADFNLGGNVAAQGFSINAAGVDFDEAADAVSFTLALNGETKTVTINQEMALAVDPDGILETGAKFVEAMKAAMTEAGFDPAGYELTASGQDITLKSAVEGHDSQVAITAPTYPGTATTTSDLSNTDTGLGTLTTTASVAAGTASFTITAGDMTTATINLNGNDHNTPEKAAAEINKQIKIANDALDADERVTLTASVENGRLVLTGAPDGTGPNITMSAGGDAVFGTVAQRDTKLASQTGGATKTVDELVTEINAKTLANGDDNPLKGRIRASNDNGKLRIENQSTQELSINGVNSAGVADGVSIADEALRRTIDGNAVRAGLTTQFNELRDQLDKLSDDASFNGINLLRGDKLTITFNETGTSAIDIQTKEGETVNALNLGVPTELKEEQLDSDVTIDELLTGLKAALDEVRSQASTFGSNLSIVQNRKSFTEAMINTLETGAGNLTLADMNTEAANLLALQTRQQLSQNSLSLASQADQSILQLLQ